jgi:uncharacterized protein (UPF0276 family)
MSTFMAEHFYLGYGIGLRPVHYSYILENLPPVDWFEAITEDYLVPGGRPVYYLEQVRQHYPVVLHGVSLSIGSSDPLNRDYLIKLKALMKRIEPAWVSDHLCWTGLQGKNLHDLMPLPYTEEAIQHVVERVKQVQDFLGRQILLENVSSYITYQASQMQEWEFLTEIAERADCLLLLDINNVFVSSFNHGFKAQDFIYGVPRQRVQQFHIAGHSRFENFIIDTHDEPVVSEVWQLYQQAVQCFGQVSTLLERDDNIPPFPELLNELQQAKQLATNVLENNLIST